MRPSRLSSAAISGFQANSPEQHAMKITNVIPDHKARSALKLSGTPCFVRLSGFADSAFAVRRRFGCRLLLGAGSAARPLTADTKRTGKPHQPTITRT